MVSVVVLARTHAALRLSAILRDFGIQIQFGGFRLSARAAAPGGVKGLPGSPFKSAYALITFSGNVGMSASMARWISCIT